MTSIKADTLSPKSKELKQWFSQHHTTTPVSTAKRKLDYRDYEPVNVEQLSRIAVSQETKVLTEIFPASSLTYTLLAHNAKQV